MKKLFIILSIALLCGLGVAKVAVASPDPPSFTTYTRTPSAQYVLPSPSFHFTGVNTYGFPYYNIAIWNGLHEDDSVFNFISDVCVPSDTTDYTFTPTMSLGDYKDVVIVSFSDNSNCNSFDNFVDFSVAEAGTPAFSVVDVLPTPPTPPPPTSLAMPITIPAATASSFLAQVSAQMADVGLLTIAIVAVAIPLAFYIIKQLMALVPKARGRRQ